MPLGHVGVAAAVVQHQPAHHLLVGLGPRGGGGGGDGGGGGGGDAAVSPVPPSLHCGGDNSRTEDFEIVVPSYKYSYRAPSILKVPNPNL